jgi:hypothetical protein
VITSDHGEQNFEHDPQDHAYELYREENDAIGILWSKTIVPAQDQTLPVKLKKKAGAIVRPTRPRDDDPDDLTPVFGKEK